MREPQKRATRAARTRLGRLPMADPPLGWPLKPRTRPCLASAHLGRQHQEKGQDFSQLQRSHPDTRQQSRYPRTSSAGAGKCRLGAVHAVGQAAKCGRIGDAIRICERRRCLFPGAVLQQAPPQCLAARQQTLVRQEGRGSLATGAAAATNVCPIVMLIMLLLAAASVADDRIHFTCRTSSQNNLGAARGPIRFELVRRCGKWIHEFRGA
jgi:hypothetical protein